MTGLEWLALLVYVSIYGYTCKHIDFSLLFQHKHVQHVVVGAGVALFMLWNFRAGIYTGLDVHFLWLSALTLTLGFRYAVLISGFVLLGITAVGKESWEMFGANGVLGVLLPICVSYAVFSLVFHRVPRHLFIYVFLCAFFPGALVIAVKMLGIGGFYVLNDIHTWRIVFDNYEVLIPLLLFPEAMLNGMTMTLLIIYKPHWVYTWNDEQFFDPPPK